MSVWEIVNRGKINHMREVVWEFFQGSMVELQSLPLADLRELHDGVEHACPFEIKEIQ